MVGPFCCGELEHVRASVALTIGILEEDYGASVGSCAFRILEIGADPVTVSAAPMFQHGA